MEILLEYLAKGFLMMLAISMPCVLVAAGIGLVVGILQAVTQVQEQTIAAAPKILGVFLVIIIGGVGFIRLLTNLFQEGMVLAFQHVPQNQEFVLEPDFHQYTRPFEYEMKDKFRKRAIKCSFLLSKFITRRRGENVNLFANFRRFDAVTT